MTLPLFRALATALVLVVTGCVVPQATMGPAGELEVLENLSGGWLAGRLPGDWVVEGGSDEHRDLVPVSLSNYPALRVTNGAEHFIAARRTQALLPVTPYLAWAWHMEPHRPPPYGSERHPVRLMVGFHGGAPDSRNRPFAWMGRSLPPHDRVLELTWSYSALERGHFEADERAATYTVRGGRENAGRWWRETVDLSALYAGAWPGDDASKAQVVFIGLAATGDGQETSGAFSGLVLSR